LRLHTSLLSGGMAKTLVAHTGKLLTLAGSARWSHGHERLDWLYAHDFAIEIAPDLENLNRLAPRIWPYVQKGLPVRFRTSAGYEIGDAEPAAAQWALGRHMALVDAVSEYEEPVITCYIGLTRGRGVSGKHAVANLTTLVDYARKRGVTIALVNLKQGPTSTPERHVQWARRAGAKITLDLGHALSCSAAQRVKIDDYIDRVADRLVGVHFYEKKTYRRHPPADMQVLGPVVDRLAQTDCRWWTIALENLWEMKVTRRMALNHLDWIGEAQYQLVANSR
jgi:hypothetical protein